MLLDQSYYTPWTNERAVGSFGPTVSSPFFFEGRSLAAAGFRTWDGAPPRFDGRCRRVSHRYRQGRLSISLFLLLPYSTHTMYIVDPDVHSFHTTANWDSFKRSYNILQRFSNSEYNQPSSQPNKTQESGLFILSLLSTSIVKVITEMTITSTIHKLQPHRLPVRVHPSLDVRIRRPIVVVFRFKRHATLGRGKRTSK